MSYRYGSVWIVFRWIRRGLEIASATPMPMLAGLYGWSRRSCSSPGILGLWLAALVKLAFSRVVDGMLPALGPSAISSIITPQLAIMKTSVATFSSRYGSASGKVSWTDLLSLAKRPCARGSGLPRT